MNEKVAKTNDICQVFNLCARIWKCPAKDGHSLADDDEVSLNGKPKVDVAQIIILGDVLGACEDVGARFVNLLEMSGALRAIDRLRSSLNLFQDEAV